MRGSLWIIATAAMAMLMGGCSAMFTTSSYGSNDLYNTDNRIQVANRLKAQAEAEAAEAAARQALWEVRTAEAYADAAEADYYASINGSPNYANIVADNYESAYARRLYGINSPTYNYPDIYYKLQYNYRDAMRYASAYDPAYYNIMVSGDQVWVEPRYVTSMFGAWGATNLTYGIYSSPWNFGWSINVDPFYYSWWGYPRYSWYDWNWTMCYNSHHHYAWCDYPYYDYYHHHYNPPRPPHHHNGNNRPNHNVVTGSGGGAGRPISNLNGNRDNSGSRYTSPTSNRNYGKVESTNTRPNRGGSISTGVNSNSNYRVNSTIVNTPVNNVGSTTTTNQNRGTRNNGSRVTTSTNSGRNNNFRQSGSSSRSSGTYRSNTTNYNRNSTSTTRQSTTIGSSGSYYGSGSSSSGTSSHGGGSTSSRR